MQFKHPGIEPTSKKNIARKKLSNCLQFYVAWKLFEGKKVSEI